MNNREFINSVKNAAIKGMLQHNILASLSIAQAILESAWGKSGLTKKANNLFGIKAFSNYRGDKIVMETTEYDKNNKPYKINAAFRAYPSLEASLEDHTKLLLNKRYDRVRQAKNYKEACQAVYDCGYATDRNYPKKLIQIIEENNLQEFDKRVPVELSKDNHVLLFQQLCNKLGIRDYEDKELKEDNIIGPRTKSCIAKMPQLCHGSTGTAVRFIQEIVGTKIDGIFLDKTFEKVKEYQASKGLDDDGIVGINTWTAMVNQGY